ncbi:MAG TPA: hypothetical protein VI874_00510, partial [Candidatus Norongarragalinales archaeon]|nr:hypothetical protein [Candidatus Norongarragalinales archaeon]
EPGKIIPPEVASVLSNSPELIIRQALYVNSAPASSGSVFAAGSNVFTVQVTVANPRGTRLRDVRVTQDFDFIPFLGSKVSDYESAGYIFEPLPQEPILEGSAVVTWLFDNVEPGQEVSAKVRTNQTLSKKDVENLATPRVFAKTANPGEAEVEVRVKVTEDVKPAGFDFTMIGIAVAVLIAIGAGYFFLMRKNDQPPSA